MHLLFSKLKVFFRHLKKNISLSKQILKYLVYLLPSILGQSTKSKRPMQIYMDVDVSLLRFKYPTTLKKLY